MCSPVPDVDPLCDRRKWQRMPKLIGRRIGGWRKEPAEGLTDGEVARIRLRTHTGRPLGSDSFVSKLETLPGRRVRPLPVGRPKKTQAGDGKIKRKRKQVDPGRLCPLGQPTFLCVVFFPTDVRVVAHDIGTTLLRRWRSKADSCRAFRSSTQMSRWRSLRWTG